MFKQDPPIIQDVSDTALWVATFRFIESQRPDALFQDPLAGRLAGERGARIAARMSSSRYVRWSVVIRTCIIDAYIQELITQGVDTIINLGCGLDTRPYRLKLPSSLRWVELDFPQIIDYKSKILASETPDCKLDRISMDLNDTHKVDEIFAQINRDSEKVLILTEGMIPYLDEKQVGTLAQTLRKNEKFVYWIVDYYSAHVAQYMNSRKRQKQMRNAPFKFFPKDWHQFFSIKGWSEAEMRYLGEASIRLGRKIPIPWWAQILRDLLRLKDPKQSRQYSGFALLKPSKLNHQISASKV